MHHGHMERADAGHDAQDRLVTRDEKREDAYQAAIAAHRTFAGACAELQHALETLAAELALWAAEKILERVNRHSK